jgi:hypothetical protein
MKGVAPLAATPFLFQPKQIMRRVLLLPGKKISTCHFRESGNPVSGMDAGSSPA